MTIICELQWPGDQVDLPGEGFIGPLTRLFHILEASLSDANRSFLLYTQARAAEEGPRAKTQEEWFAARYEEHVIEERLEAELPPDLTYDQRWAERERISMEARIEAKRARWQRGELPRVWLARDLHLYARCFVFALDGIAQGFEVLKRLPNPGAAAEALTVLISAAPDLKGVRDTSHHQEDRVRGLDRKKERLNTQLLVIDTFFPEGLQLHPLGRLRRHSRNQ